LVLGLQDFSRQDLETVQAAGEKLQIQVLGLARIAEDVSRELARATIDSVTVLGALHASAVVKAALALSCVKCSSAITRGTATQLRSDPRLGRPVQTHY